MAALIYDGIRQRFEFLGTFSESGRAKAAGFLWDPAKAVWHTKQPRTAAALIDIALNGAKERLAGVTPASDRLRMTFVAERNRFEVDGPRQMNYYPKEAGFRWDPNAIAWWTTDSSKATRLLAFADEIAKEALRMANLAAQERLAASRSTGLDIDLPRPPGQDYMPFQKAGVTFTRSVFASGKKGVLIADAMGLGKGHPVDTNVLTPQGWKAIGTVTPGDQVIGSNGKPCTVTGVYQRGTLDVYQVEFQDGSSVRCDADHLWAVNTPSRRYHGSPLRVKSVAELIANPLTDLNGNRQHFIPMVEPVEFEDKPEIRPLDPYLLGYLIGNGGIKYHVGVTIPSDESVSELDSLLPEGVELTRSENFDWRISSGQSGRPNTVLDALRKLGLFGKGSPEKFIPDAYLFAPAECREALLQGIMDADGHARPDDNNVEYSTASRRLAEDVRSLVQSLGGIAKINTGKASYKDAEGKQVKCLDRHRISVILPNFIHPFRLTSKAANHHPRPKYPPSRSIKSITPDGKAEVVCISVDAPDSLYVTEHFLVTHNTIQALGVINTDETIKNVLAIAPASVKINWAIEARKWLVRPFRIGICATKKPKNSLWYYCTPGESEKFNFLIINYDILKQFQADIHSRVWDLLIVDEAHYLKDAKSQRSQFVFGRRDKGKKDWAIHPIPCRNGALLTGTPIVNRPDELYNLIKFCDPDTWGSWFNYAQTYCGLQSGSYGYQLGTPKRLDELQVKLRSSIMIRRAKEDVLTELPAKVRQVIELPADGLDKTISAETALVKSHTARLESLKKAAELAKASDDPEEWKTAVDNLKKASMIAFDEMAKVRHETALAKVPMVIAHLEEALQHGKVICFAYHRDVMELITNHFHKEVVWIHGGVNTGEERQLAVDLFQKDPKYRLFVGSVVAAAEGITLTASSHVVFAELDWRPGKVSQCEDRAHRIGQQDSVLVQHLVVEGSIDAIMAKTIVAKQRVIEQAMDNEVAMAEANTPPIFGEMPDDTTPLVPGTSTNVGAATTSASKAAIAAEALLITETQIEAIHKAMQVLAAHDTDHATGKNAIGFSKIDVAMGHDLAERENLTAKQAALAKRILLRYRNTQLATLAPHLVTAIWGDK